MDWTALLYVLGAGLLGWLGYRTIRGNPQAFSKANISKSITTTGILALILIGIVAICVMILRHT